MENYAFKLYLLIAANIILGIFIFFVFIKDKKYKFSFICLFLSFLNSYFIYKALFSLESKIDNFPIIQTK